MKSFKLLLCISLLMPIKALAFKWNDMWQTPDQQGIALLKANKPKDAAQVFKNKNWQSVEQYRDGNYEQAYIQFVPSKSSDGQYNAGNSAAFAGKYKEAIAAYDKAIAINANNTDAIANRDIVKKIIEKQEQEKKEGSEDPSKNDKDQKNESSQKNGGDKKQDDAQKNQSKDEKSDQSKQQRPQKNNNSPMTHQQNDQPMTDSKMHAKNDDKDQILRRLSDDPGGLLQQKFLRDYSRRHGMIDNSDQGDY
jgi:Ca-activated chloride channel family protein